jgi:hypothetical protein
MRDRRRELWRQSRSVAGRAGGRVPEGLEDHRGPREVPLGDEGAEPGWRQGRAHSACAAAALGAASAVRGPAGLEE